MLFDRLAEDAAKWRLGGYPCPEYPLIGEILRHQCATAPGDDRLHLRYLRDAQFRALEVYWFVRLQKATPRMMDLYKDYYAGQTDEFCRALGVPMRQEELRLVPDIDDVVTRVIGNADFVKEKKIEPVAEMAALDYPSYILALAMGAGKTVLIGAIIATEFAMAMAYKSAGKFMRNALVFAPGKTILESLREIESMPFGEILPPSLTGEFNANLKIEYAREGSKIISVQHGSAYNLIVSNTERIRLRASVRRRKNQSELDVLTNLHRSELEANLRLQAIASLPDLGVFSDEAHHVYGETAEKELKRARETVNYIHKNTPLIAVVNTTGTPYAGRQPLREVIFWYGLKEGIADGVLKDLQGGIVDFADDKPGHEGTITSEVVRAFFDKYRDVRLPNGAKAKIAFYFRNKDHLKEMRPQIERAMIEIGEDTSQMLVCTNDSPPADRDEFNRLNSPDSQKRVMLLVNIGTEGWNCPSLFACALIRKGTSSVFVLQSATRCLRQTPGNKVSASIFLNWENREKLNEELQNNFGVSRFRLVHYKGETVPVKFRLRKAEELPKLEITRTQRRVVAGATRGKDGIRLTAPKKGAAPSEITYWIMSPKNWSGKSGIFVAEGEARIIRAPSLTTDCRAAAVRIAANYHLPLAAVYRALKSAYPGGGVPEKDITALLEQIEEQTSDYEVREETIKEVLALVRLFGDDGGELFDKDDKGRFHRIRYSKPFYDRMIRDNLLPEKGGDLADSRDISFHYTPYNLASKPEREFLEKTLAALNEDPDDIAAFLYTGGVADARKTDFHFEYKGVDDKYHRYFPDFVLVKKTGKFYIVEIKAENEQDDATVAAKEKAVEKLRLLNPEKIRHEVVYCGAGIDHNHLKNVHGWLYGKEEE